MLELTNVPEFLQPSIGQPTTEVHSSTVNPIARARRIARLPVERIGHAPLTYVGLVAILSGHVFNQ
jgi:hypothetical protein